MWNCRAIDSDAAVARLFQLNETAPDFDLPSYGGDELYREIVSDLLDLNP